MAIVFSVAALVLSVIACVVAFDAQHTAECALRRVVEVQEQISRTVPVLPRLAKEVKQMEDRQATWADVRRTLGLPPKR